ncbi:molybdopterin molybdotransferase MoeA [Aggregatilinea lenta]|uniref:molybdopterin molybdotransferase MoeA n=1 Tax=Aggregatilinea lenta TaxID=913108 RepID=UPI0013C36106|nr:gephyrin-like molybdotransferase Glp [Aggregatilinea lenta]
MPELMSVEEVVQRVLGQIVRLDAENVVAVDALGRVLAEDVVADADIPPFANSSMDGYALRAADTTGASAEHPVRLNVVADIPAGHVSERAIGAGEAARIMTGAPLPPGADAVVQVELTDAEWTRDDTADLAGSVGIVSAADAGDNVRDAGEDLRQGQAVLRAGTVLRPQDLGVLVSLGRTQVSVVRQPRVAIIATGDELVEAGEPLGPGQIRNSNSAVIAGLVSQNGGIPIRLPIAKDNLDAVRERFAEALAAQPDLIVSTAGVSVGAHDLVRAVIEELGELALWRVNLRPGKPLAYGRVGSVPFFGLPGNPVSTMITFDLFVRPAILKQGGRPLAAPVTTAVVTEDMTFDGRETYMRVTLRQDGDRLVAETTGTQSSGALLSMVLADGLLIVPAGTTHVAAGTELGVRLLRA